MRSALALAIAFLFWTSAAAFALNYKVQGSGYIYQTQGTGYVYSSGGGSGVNPVADGTCNGVGGSGTACPSTAGCCASNASVSVTTTGGSGGCLIIVGFSNANSGAAPTVSSVAASGLTFTKRQSKIGSGPGGGGGSSEGFDIEEWSAPYTTTLSALSVTVTWTATAFYSIQAEAVKNTSGNTCSFDPNAGADNTIASTWASPTLSQTTTNTHDLLIAATGTDCNISASSQQNPTLFGSNGGAQIGYGFQNAGADYVAASAFSYNPGAAVSYTDTLKLNNSSGTGCTSTYEFVGLVDALTGDGGGGSASCPYGTGLGDGCPAATAAGKQFPNFFTSSGLGNALQMGQSYQSASFTGSIAGTTLTVSGVTGTIDPNGHVDTLQGSGIPSGTTIVSGSGSTWTLSANLGTITAESMTSLFRPPWNVAGVEYPVGVESSVTLTNAATLAATLSTCPGTGNLCIAGGTTHVFVANGPVTCVGSTCTSYSNSTCAGTQCDLHLEDIDFTGNGGWAVDVTHTAGAIKGNVYLKDVRFGAGTNFQSGGDIYGYNGPSCCAFGAGVSSPADIYTTVLGCTTMLHTEWDMGSNVGSSLNVTAPQTPGLFPGIPSCTPATVQYNYFANSNGRWQFGTGLLAQYNLWRNSNYNSTAHGEITANDQLCTTLGTGNPPSGTYCNSPYSPYTVEYDYNTMLQDSNQCGGNTTIFYAGSGTITTASQNVVAQNNTFIINGCSITITNVNTGSSQITFTVNGGEGQLVSGELVCVVLADCHITQTAELNGQASGSPDSSGVWNYTRTWYGGTSTPLNAWVEVVIDSPSVGLDGVPTVNTTSKNNHLDDLGSQYTWSGNCGINSSAGPPLGTGTNVSSGNFNMRTMATCN